MSDIADVGWRQLDLDDHQPFRSVSERELKSGSTMATRIVCRFGPDALTFTGGGGFIRRDRRSREIADTSTATGRYRSCWEGNVRGDGQRRSRIWLHTQNLQPTVSVSAIDNSFDRRKPAAWPPSPLPLSADAHVTKSRSIWRPRRYRHRQPMTTTASGNPDRHSLSAATSGSITLTAVDDAVDDAMTKRSWFRHQIASPTPTKRGGSASLGNHSSTTTNPVTYPT